MIAERFAETFGGEPESVWRAPGRVNIIGEHTDYNDGFVLPFAIDRGVRCAIRRRDDEVVRCVSTRLGAAAETTVSRIAAAPGRWESYVLGVVALLDRLAGRAAGFDMLFDSDVPEGAGLSSSAALSCSAAIAVDDSLGLGLSRVELARVAREAESVYAGVPVGVMDQIASLCASEGHAVLLDTRSMAIEQVAIPPGWSWLVVDTQVKHSLADGGYAERRRACESAAALLGVPALRDVSAVMLDERRGELADVQFKRARHVITENARVLDAVDALRRGDPAALGAAMVASHLSLRDDFEVSTPELDLAVEVAMDAGATGARMTGGGFGGSTLVLTSPEKRDRITDEVLAASSARGFKAPRSIPVSPAAAASREQ